MQKLILPANFVISMPSSGDTLRNEPLEIKIIHTEEQLLEMQMELRDTFRARVEGDAPEEDWDEDDEDSEEAAGNSEGNAAVAEFDEAWKEWEQNGYQGQLNVWHSFDNDGASYAHALQVLLIPSQGRRPDESTGGPTFCMSWEIVDEAATRQAFQELQEQPGIEEGMLSAEALDGDLEAIARELILFMDHWPKGTQFNDQGLRYLD